MKSKSLFLYPLFISAITYSQTAITNVTIVDVQNQKLIAGQTVLITDSIISAITPAGKMKIPLNAQIIDGRGKYLMPGMTESHAHFFMDGSLYSGPDAIDLRKFVPFENQIAATKQKIEDFLRRYLQCGITTVIDPGSTFNFLLLRDSFANKNFAPSVYMAGPLIITTYLPSFSDNKNDDPYILATNTEEATTAVQQQLPFHPDFIKILYVTDLSGEHIEDSARKFFPVVKAIVEEAHTNNLKVAVHATERITAQLAAEAGCDYLVHGIEDEIISNDFIKLLKDKNIIVCPTLNVVDGYYKTFTQKNNFSAYEIKHSNPFSLGTLNDLQHLDTSLANWYKKAWAATTGIGYNDSIRKINLKKMSEAGVMIASGTDAGNIGTEHASSYLAELLSMQQCGMSNWQIIQSSTINPVKILEKEKNYGSVSTGKIADMILLDDNPVDSLYNLTKINMVFKKGIAILPDALIKETPEMIVQSQLNAYNVSDMETFLNYYDKDVELFNFPDSLIGKGTMAIKKMYVNVFNNPHKAHCEIKSRTVSGNTVIDKESITGFDMVPLERVVIYKIEGPKIKRVYFIN